MRGGGGVGRLLFLLNRFHRDRSRGYEWLSGLDDCDMSRSFAEVTMQADRSADIITEPIKACVVRTIEMRSGRLGSLLLPPITELAPSHVLKPLLRLGNAALEEQSNFTLPADVILFSVSA